MQDALLSVSVNGVIADEAAVVRRDSTGGIYVREEQLQAWRLRVPSLPALEYEGIRYFLLNNIATKLTIDEGAQALFVTVAPMSLERTEISYAVEPVSDRLASGTGAYLNYDITLQADNGKIGAAGLFEAIAYWGPGTGTSNFAVRSLGSGAHVLRLDTNWTVDDPSRMRSLRLGDSVSRGGVGGSPVRFGGIQLARNFSVQPRFITMPLPSLSGAAELPSVIDIYVNNALVRKQDVPAGPFDIVEIPVVTGSGDVQLIVRDVLGRQQILNRPYFQASTQLRSGLDDYSYEIGFLRRAFGRHSNDYGAAVFSGTHRYGFSHGFTGEAHFEATADVQQAGIGGSLVAPGLGRLALSMFSSHSEAGTGVGGTLEFQRTTRGLSLGLHAQLASADYRTVGMSPNRRPPSSVIQAFAGFQLGRSSIGLSYLRRDSRDEPDVEIASANWSFRLKGLGSLNFIARTALEGTRDTRAEMSWTIPLGHRTSASLGGRLAGEHSELGASIQQNLPQGDGIGYRLEGAAGDVDRASARVMLRTGLADYETLLTWVDGRTGVRLSTSGSVGIADEMPFVSHRIDRSFARVSVGDYPGVRVYADNHLVGRTGDDGKILVPSLRSYDRNVIRIEATDLPLDAELEDSVQIVRPYARQGVRVDFKAKPSHAALIRLVLDDGRDLPTGSRVRLNDGGAEFVSAPGGEVYITGADKDISGIAEWADGSCQFAMEAVAAEVGRIDVQCARTVQ